MAFVRTDDKHYKNIADKVRFYLENDDKVRSQEMSDTIDSIYSKGKHDGWNEGYGLGQTEGYEMGEQAGQETGFREGKEAGLTEGYQSGFADGKCTLYGTYIFKEFYESLLINAPDMFYESFEGKGVYSWFWDFETEEYRYLEIDDINYGGAAELFGYIYSVPVDGVIYTKNLQDMARWYEYEAWNNQRETESEGLIITFTQQITVSSECNTFFNAAIDTSVDIHEAGYNEGEIAGLDKGRAEGQAQGKAEVYDEIKARNEELAKILNGSSTNTKSFYDEFWDMVQKSGKRTNYSHAFFNWATTYIRPKYKVIPTEGDINSTFNNVDKIVIVEKAYFDFSQIPTLTADYTFNSCENLLIVEDCGIPALTRYSRTWRLCSYLHTIEVVRSNEDTTFALAFDGCKALENLTIEGVIGQNGFDVKDSTKLSKASITSIINALSTTTTGLAITLSKTAVNSAFGSTESEEWALLINTRPNWTINLV